MADSGGHWDSLAEAQKLTQAVQVAGIIEEDVKRGGPVGLLPAWQLRGLRLEYLRESAGQTAAKTSAGATLGWTDAVKYDKITRDLSRAYIQTPLDKFNAQVYGGLNNYEAIQLVENKKAIIQFINDKMIYGDATYATGDPEPDGFHALAQAYPTPLNGETNGLDIDAGGALTIADLRQLRRNMKYGIDYFLVPHVIADRIDASLEEAGIASYAGFGRITRSMSELGDPVMGWGGIPIVRSDYLVAEQAGTGEGSNAKAKYSSGTQEYSIFAVKRGQPAMKEPGVGFVWGGEGLSDGNLMRVERFEKLENQDASGLRLTSYYGLADGSIMALGRIHGITDAAIT